MRREGGGGANGLIAGSPPARGVEHAPQTWRRRSMTPPTTKPGIISMKSSANTGLVGICALSSSVGRSPVVANRRDSTVPRTVNIAPTTSMYPAARRDAVLVTGEATPCMRGAAKTSVSRDVTARTAYSRKKRLKATAKR